MSKKKILALDFTYFFSYSIFLFIILYSNVQSFIGYFKYLNLFACALLVLAFFIQNYKYTLKNILSIIFVILVSVITFYFGLNSNRTDYYIIELFLLLIVSKNINIDKIISFDFWFKIINIFIIIFLAKAGIINNGQFFRNGVYRQALGFTHPNVLGIVLSSCAIDCMYICSKKKMSKLLPSLLTMVFLYIIQFVANSRSSFYLLVFVFIIFLLDKTRIIQLPNRFKNCFKFSFVICTILSFLFVYLFSIKSDLGILIDKFLSGRLFYGDLYLKHTDVNFFGNVLYFTGNEALINYGRYTMILDNSYIYLVLRFGIFNFLLFLILFYNFFKRNIIKKNYFLVWIMLAFIFYGIFERFTFIVFYNPFLLFFKEFIYDKNQLENSN